MIGIGITIIDQPSRSKGWARYKVTDAAGVPVMTSSTGNEWMSAPHGGEFEPGAVLTLVIECELITGKGRAARRVRSAEAVALIVTDGAEDTVQYRPGSQGMTLRVTGARAA